MFDYVGMQKVARRLLGPKEFGNPFTLKKVGKSKYDATTKKTIKTYKLYDGVGVLLPLPEEAIGSLSNIIKAGDKKFVCQMKDETIIPIETKDQIEFQGETYNILNVKTLIPNGKKLLIHTLLVRKSSEDV